MSSEPAPAAPVVGIVCALPMELAALRSRCRPFLTDTGNGLTFRGLGLGSRRIIVVEGAAGQTRAAQATHALIDAYHPAWILSAGFSGALWPELKVGDVVTGNEIVSASGPMSLKIDVKMPADPAAGRHVGRLCTSPQIVRTIEEKRELGQATGALAVDMESLIVGHICHERQVRFMAVRAISDDLSADLPREVLAVLGKKGTVRAGALLGSIFKRPGSVKDLWALREKAQLAADHLGKFLEGVILQLPLPPAANEA